MGHARRIAVVLWSLCSIPVRAEHEALVVASDGSGHFKTIQAAVDSIPEHYPGPRLIVIKPGTYKEQVVINGIKPFIVLRGADKDPRKTVITFDRYATVEDPKSPGKRIGVHGSETMAIHADHFTAENITFENTAGRLAPAMALRTESDKLVFRNCRFLSWQDTLFLSGKRIYFHECYIEGRVDFISGSATTVFEKCDIHATDGGVVAAASTKPKTAFGFVFLKCKITCKEDRSYLGTPWQRARNRKRPSGSFS